MLTIRQLFYTLSGLYIVLLFAGLILVRWVWFYPQEMNRYLQHQQNELQSLATALEIRREQLQANANDYGHWNETWNYILQDTPAYLADNFTASSMSTLNLDAVMILSHEFSIRLAQQLNSAAHRIEPSPVAFHKWLSEYTIRNDIFNSSPAQDVVRIDNIPYLLAISPVMKTDHSGPQAGWLLFFQKIDDALLKSLSRITRITLQEIPLPDAQSNAIMPLELPIYTAATQHERCIYNSRQEPAFCLELIHSTFSMPVFISPGTLVVYLLLTLIPVLLFAMLMHLLTGPIRKATQLLQRNNFDGLLRPVLFSSPLRVKELRQLRDAFNELVYTTRQQQARLEQLSNTDRLTGIPNRRAFDEALDNTWRRISRHQQQVALILADIDY